MALLSLRVTQERCCVLHGQQPLPPAGVPAIGVVPAADIPDTRAAPGRCSSTKAEVNPCTPSYGLPASPYATLVHDKPLLPCLGLTSGVPQRPPAALLESKTLEDALFYQEQCKAELSQVQAVGVVYGGAPSRVDTMSLRCRWGPCRLRRLPAPSSHPASSAPHRCCREPGHHFATPLGYFSWVGGGVPSMAFPDVHCHWLCLGLALALSPATSVPLWEGETFKVKDLKKKKKKD